MPRIKDVKTFVTCPGDVNLVVVRVDTDEPGLFGLGCATFTQRCKAVVSVVEEYLKPLLIGRNAGEIQELWYLMHNNAYWRAGPILNCATAGVDMALWDIKGKMAGMPVYDLLGGKCREAITLYGYANGRCREEILERAQQQWENGMHHIRLQYFLLEGFQQHQRPWRPDGAKDGFYQDPHKYVEETIKLFELARSKMGDEPEFLHDVHERIPANDAVYLAKALEPMRPFFLEDLFRPEEYEYYRQVKRLCATPVAHGELCTHPTEWLTLVSERLIDFIRIHASMIGGVTPTVKLAHLCEAYGIRTAWHCPSDMNPVGQVAQMHIDISSGNFGIQEWPDLDPKVNEVFDGLPVIKNGYAYINDRPGFGVDFNEKAAERYPFRAEVVSWTQFRHTDGSLYTP